MKDKLYLVKKYIEEEYDVKLQVLKHRKIIFYTLDGRFCLCSHYSKYNKKTKSYRIDISKIQADQFDGFESVILIPRLGDDCIAEINWLDIRPHLTEAAMIYSEHGKEHWALLFREGEIYLRGILIGQYELKNFNEIMGEKNEN